MSQAQGLPGTTREGQTRSQRDCLPRGGFPKSERLRKRADFQRVQGKGRAVRTPHLVVLVQAERSSHEAARLGVTATRRVGNAVVRNRAKRVVRSAFRATREIWPPGIDVVIIVRRFETDMNTSTLALELWGARDQIQRSARQTLAQPDKREPPC